jgi:DNA-binding transcriptional LysR family regulator
VRWDDLRVFLAVAQAGSLRRAARALQLGQPTVVRRLRDLERELGGRLFERSPDGHRLTKGGQEVLPLAQAMADGATAIDRRRATLGEGRAGRVRLAASEWQARFLAPHLSRLVVAHPGMVVELVETHIDPDLDRRAADLYVRHGLPPRGHLVRVGLGTMHAALYGAATLVAAQPAARTEARWTACAWVAYDGPHEHFGSMAWLLARLGERGPRVRANRVALQIEAIQAGAGLGILPCFAGDADPALVRLTPPIEDLATDQWLLVHPDLKDVARVRACMSWIRAVFAEGRAALAGRPGPERARPAPRARPR